MTTTTTPKIVRKWKIDAVGAIACQHADGNYSWGHYLADWTPTYLMANYPRHDDLVKVVFGDYGPPTWEDPEWVAVQKAGARSLSKPSAEPIVAAPTKCRYATPQPIPSIESETVELWRWQAPEEEQLAPARDRVLRRAKRLVREMPICGGVELPVELRVQAGFMSVQMGNKRAAIVSAAFLCPHCSGGGK